MSAQELADRPTETDASLWDEEDYKTIAAKSCLLYKTAFDASLGENYADWTAQSIQWTEVQMTAGALEGHSKWGPINDVTFALWANSLSRASGGNGVEVVNDGTIESFNLCLELGVDLNE
jgi:hypothetical protein